MVESSSANFVSNLNKWNLTFWLDCFDWFDLVVSFVAVNKIEQVLIYSSIELEVVFSTLHLFSSCHQLRELMVSKMDIFYAFYLKIIIFGKRSIIKIRMFALINKIQNKSKTLEEHVDIIKKARTVQSTVSKRTVKSKQKSIKKDRFEIVIQKLRQ